MFSSLKAPIICWILIWSIIQFESLVLCQKWCQMPIGLVVLVCGQVEVVLIVAGVGEVPLDALSIWALRGHNRHFGKLEIRKLIRKCWPTGNNSHAQHTMSKSPYFPTISLLVLVSTKLCFWSFKSNPGRIGYMNKKNPFLLRPCFNKNLELPLHELMSSIEGRKKRETMHKMERRQIETWNSQFTVQVMNKYMAVKITCSRCGLLHLVAMRIFALCLHCVTSRAWRDPSTRPVPMFFQLPDPSRPEIWKWPGSG